MEQSNVRMRIDIDISLVNKLIDSGGASVHTTKNGEKRFITLLINPMKEPKEINIGSFKSTQTHVITVLGNKNKEGKRTSALFPGCNCTAFVGKGYEENISIPKKKTYNKYIQRPY